MLLRRAAASGAPLAAVAFGNEIGGERAIEVHLTPAQYAAGLGQLQALVDDVWGATGSRRRPPPRVLGPNAQWDAPWVGELMRLAPRAAVLSHHLYPLGAGSLDASELASKVLRPDFLDKLKAVASGIQGQLRGAARNGSMPRGAAAGGGGGGGVPELWVTELGGAYNSGRPGVTDAFLSSFWRAPPRRRRRPTAARAATATRIAHLRRQ
eukprot:7386156-Prymnesium_polylepis.1